MGGLRGFGTGGRAETMWHAMLVARLLRSTEGVGIESHRVAGWHRVASRSRGVAESQYASKWLGVPTGLAAC